MSLSKSFSEAVTLLAEGGVLAFPTETFYACGCDATNAKAVERVYQLKHRTATKALPLIVGNTEDVAGFFDIEAIPDKLLALWPCSMTLLLKPRVEFPSLLIDDEGKLAVRVSPHPIAAGLARALGKPLTSSSANLQGEEPARLAQELNPILLENLDGVLPVEENLPAGGKPSTIIDPLDEKHLRIVREGALPKTFFEALGFLLH